MKLAVVSEATYDSFRRGNIFWYLSEFFVHQPDAYDESGIKYYIVKHPYQVFVDGHEVEAVELDTYASGHGYGKRPVSLRVFVSKNGRTQKLQGNYLHNFGDHVKINEIRKLDLPPWTGSNG